MMKRMRSRGLWVSSACSCQEIHANDIQSLTTFGRVGFTSPLSVLPDPVPPLVCVSPSVFVLVPRVPADPVSFPLDVSVPVVPVLFLEPFFRKPAKNVFIFASNEAKCEP